MLSEVSICLKNKKKKTKKKKKNKKKKKKNKKKKKKKKKKTGMQSEDVKRSGFQLGGIS